MRVADVWMDGYKKYFYASTFIYEIRNATFNKYELQSIEDWKKKRNNLKCKNFEWFMQNVIPEMPIPQAETRFYGEIMNVKSKACFELFDDYFVGMTYVCYEHKVIPHNFFSLAKNGLLRWKDKCIKALYPSPALRLVECPQLNTREDLENFGYFKVNLIGNIMFNLIFTDNNNPFLNIFNFI